MEQLSVLLSIMFVFAVVIIVSYFINSYRMKNMFANDFDLELYASVIGWGKYILRDEDEHANNLRMKYAEIARKNGLDIVEQVRIDLLDVNRKHDSINWLRSVIKDAGTYLNHVNFYSKTGLFLIKMDETKSK